VASSDCRLGPPTDAPQTPTGSVQPPTSCRYRGWADLVCHVCSLIARLARSLPHCTQLNRLGRDPELRASFRLLFGGGLLLVVALLA